MSDTLLELLDVTVAYGGVTAVRNLSIKVRREDFVTIIGANGAGKTSTFSAVSGLAPISRGEIRFQGERIDRMKAPDVARLGIVQVPEGRRVFPYLTVMENLKIGASLQKDSTRMAPNLDRVFTLFPDLKARWNAKGGSLSGGQQQMLAVARALMAGPRLLMLDEPSLGLSPLLVKQLARRLRQISEEGTPLVLVEQNARMALGLAQYGYVMENGELSLEGRSEELLKDKRVIKAFLGT